MELTLYHVLKLWFADVHRYYDVFWQGRISVRPFWLVLDFDAAIWSWKPKSKHRRNVSLTGKSDETTAPTWSENINLASRELICAQVILKGRHYLRFLHEFAFGICFQRLAAWVSPGFSAARDVIWTARGNSLIVGGNTSLRATAKPSMIKWFHLVLPEYCLTATEMENSVD